MSGGLFRRCIFLRIWGIILIMKRALALALVTLATSVVVSAQIHGVPPSVTSFGPGRGRAPGVPASVTSLGHRGFGGNHFRGGVGFGQRHGSRFRNPEFHHRGYGYWPYYGYGYWPYYGYYGWDYPFDAYTADAYEQSYPQQTQPIVVVVDPKSSDDRYGDHSFEEQRSAPPPQAKAPPPPAAEQDPTVLVFRDGHKQEIRNYAIVGQMLWDFGAKGTRKIPLSDLDLDATHKLNDERGVDFVPPKT
jgi:hypothetical protein